ncbi:hypothetical protein BHM03_00010534 [Ensete ventricosum]|nr:hypothetical protein BHM03_00010534 [Ensete ventricosum]
MWCSWSHLIPSIIRQVPEWVNILRHQNCCSEKFTPREMRFLSPILHLSYPSLKATVLDGNLVIVNSESVHFDTELPHYSTKDGVYRDPSGNGRIVSPTLMWVEALDVLLEKLKSKVDYGKVVAISGSGQQHGSVYWNKRGKAILTSLDPKKPLRSQLEDAFSVRAIIEGQFLSMRGHAERFGMPTPPNRIIATGGASKNESILKSIASIFGCPVYTVQRPGNLHFNLLSCAPDSASLGAALRAAHGWLCNKEGRFVPISCLYGDKLDKTSLSAKLAFPAGDADLLSKYTVLVNKRMQIEKNLVEKLGRS